MPEKSQFTPCCEKKARCLSCSPKSLYTLSRKTKDLQACKRQKRYKGKKEEQCHRCSLHLHWKRAGWSFPVPRHQAISRFSYWSSRNKTCQQKMIDETSFSPFFVLQNFVLARLGRAFASHLAVYLRLARPHQPRRSKEERPISSKDSAPVWPGWSLSSLSLGDPYILVQAVLCPRGFLSFCLVDSVIVECHSRRSWLHSSESPW